MIPFRGFTFVRFYGIMNPVNKTIGEIYDRRK